MGAAQQVRLIPLGTATRRVGFDKLVESLNGVQQWYEFVLDDPLRNLPPPTIPHPAGNFLPRYDSAELFNYMKIHRSGGPGSLPFGVIDSEIYDDLFSTTDIDNTAGIVSTHVTSLKEVLALSQKTVEQYIELEIGIQLLAMAYRQRASIRADPAECALPWHIDRRECIFDYYGLSAGDTQKLTSPKISERSMAELRQLEVPQTQIDATLAIVKIASTTMWREVLRRAPSDPVVALGAGAVLGMMAGLVPSQSLDLVGLCTIGVLFILGRLGFLKRRSE
jgi:hypothetical protein